MAKSQFFRQGERLAKKMINVARGSAIAAESSVMFKSPVRDGIFKNNWFTEINGISSKTIDKADASGSTRLAEAESISMRMEIGDSISFVNNIPYANRLEYGYSDQAPNGMVRITAAQWPLIVAKVARSIK